MQKYLMNDGSQIGGNFVISNCVFGRSIVEADF